jgi:hypothetical protein
MANGKHRECILDFQTVQKTDPYFGKNPFQLGRRRKIWLGIHSGLRIQQKLIAEKTLCGEDPMRRRPYAEKTL